MNKPDVIIRVNRVIQKIVLAKLTMKFCFVFGDKTKQKECSKLLEEAIDELIDLIHTI